MILVYRDNKTLSLLRAYAHGLILHLSFKFCSHIFIVIFLYLLLSIFPRSISDIQGLSVSETYIHTYIYHSLKVHHIAYKTESY